MRRITMLWPFALAAVLALNTISRGQPCEPGWIAETYRLSGLNGVVHCATEFDDGRGPALYVGGAFSVAGGAVVSNLARWDGDRWEAVGEVGPDSTVYALAVHDEGDGPALFVGGRFRNIGDEDYTGFAKWDGTAWSRPAQNLTNCTSFSCVPTVRAMAVFDEGDGPALYVGGNFQRVPALGWSRVFRYVDGEWAMPLAGAVSADDVEAMVVHDQGDGPALYIGGGDGTSGSPRDPLYMLRGGAVSVVPGVDDSVWALLSADLGDGPRLYASTDAIDAVGETIYSVAGWDGLSWSRVGPALAPSGFVRSMAVHDAGDGPRLVVGGSMEILGQGETENLLRLDGDQWTDVFGLAGYWAFDVEALFSWTERGEPVLVIGGDFYPPALEPWEHLLRVGRGGAVRAFNGGMPGGVRTIEASPDEGLLYVVLARPEQSSWDTLDLYTWDGTAFAYVTGPFDAAVYDLLVVRDGGQTMVYAAGDFSTVAGQTTGGLARWDGTVWHGLGLGDREDVGGIEWLDPGDGPALYAYGDFSQLAGVPARGVARYEAGVWTGFGDGLSSVYTLEVYDDGDGPALYAGGAFDSPTGLPGGGLARWDGVGWNDEGLNRNSRVFDLEVFDDGTGPGLYATGFFIDYDTTPDMRRIGRWDGVQWSPLGEGISGAPGGSPATGSRMLAFDDGTGEKLYVGGRFLGAGGAGPYIGAWDGEQWHDVGAADGTFSDLEVLPGPRGDTLYAAGAFELIDPSTVSATLAERRGCARCPADIDGDGALTIFDFLAFQNLFQDGDPAADFDGDGGLTIFDFLAFQNAFDAGCP